MLQRRWTASCDEPGCPTTWIAEEGDLDRWDAGIALTDHGWDCGPNRPETYCPEHAREVA